MRRWHTTPLPPRTVPSRGMRFVKVSGTVRILVPSAQRIPAVLHDTRVFRYHILFTANGWHNTVHTRARASRHESVLSSVVSEIDFAGRLIALGCSPAPTGYIFREEKKKHRGPSQFYFQLLNRKSRR